MLPFHIIACVAFGCFILSVIFWIVILRKMKNPQDYGGAKVIYTPRTTRP